MEFKQPFLKLPVRLCADTLAAEVRALPDGAWEPHPQRFVGNEAVPLITPGGQITSAISGPMAPTEFLGRCPYIREIMGELGAVWGRSRLMGLGPGADVPPHVDIDYYWRTHVRIHIPVITNEKVQFTCDGETVHMGAGECWAFDTFRAHAVHNGGAERRVHLVLDTVGGEYLWELMRAAEKDGGAQPVREIPPGGQGAAQLRFEQLNSPKVMTPWEIRCHLAFLRGQALPAPELDPVMTRLDKFASAWTAAWTVHGESDAGVPAYRELLVRARADIAALGASRISLRNERGIDLALERIIFTTALSPDAQAATSGPAAAPVIAAPTRQDRREKFTRPIFIVSTPRSGSTMLFEALAKAPELFTIGGESHHAIESIPELSPATRGWSSNRLTAEDAQEGAVEQLALSFYSKLRDRDGRLPDGKVRMLEKTPKNAVRVPFFDAAFGGSHFVYLHRDVRQTLSSMIDAWQSGRFRTYPGLPGWQGHPWSLLLVPGWEKLRGLPLHEVVAHQWAITTEHLLDDLSRLQPERVRAVDYAELVAEPQRVVESLVRSLDLRWDRQLGPELPLSRTTLSKPSPDKWRRNAVAIEAALPIVAAAEARAREFLERNRPS